MTLATPIHQYRAGGRVFTADGVALLPGLLLTTALSFNAVLALVNAQVTPMPPAAVIAVEIGIVAAIHVMALLAFRPEMRPWYALIVFLVLFGAFRGFGSEGVEVRFLRDAALIPTLVLLGMCFRLKDLMRWILIVHAIVLVFMAMEALFTDFYSELFDIRTYYMNTRGYQLSDFWNAESNLYVSASRPDERIYLPFLNLHRVSSIFLEPVSLGNYCAIITGLVCVLYHRFSRGALAFLILGNIALIIACDGRLALVCSVLLVLVSVFVRFLPRRSAFLYLPLAVFAAILVVEILGLPVGGDDFPGRIAHTVDLLQRYGIADYLGLADTHLSEAVDSGVAYLIITQSVLGLIVLWTFIALTSREETVEQRRLVHVVCLYLALNMLVSFSFISIKTAALLWAVYGVLQLGERAEATGTQASRAHGPA